jgi:hypothetical protein
MPTQYRLVQSGKTASGGCSAGPRFVRACSATDLFYLFITELDIFPGFFEDTISSERFCEIIL